MAQIFISYATPDRAIAVRDHICPSSLLAPRCLIVTEFPLHPNLLG